MHTVGISGSLRRGSSNHALLQVVPELEPRITIHLYDGLARLPHFSPDLDVEDAPSEVRAWRDLVREADGLVISSPEYAHGIPGSLKNGLDWLVSGVEIVGKPVLVWSASPGGADYAHPQLLEVLRVMSANVLADASLRITTARRAFDASGRLVDRALARELEQSLARLLGADPRAQAPR